MSSRGGPPAAVEGVELVDAAQVPVVGQAPEPLLQPHRALDVAERVAAERRRTCSRGDVAAPEHRGVDLGRRPAARRSPAAAAGGRAARRSTRESTLPVGVRGHRAGVDVDRRRPAGRSARRGGALRSSGASPPGTHTTSRSSSPAAAASMPAAARRDLDASRSMRRPNGFTNRERRPTTSNTSSVGSWRPRSPVRQLVERGADAPGRLASVA